MTKLKNSSINVKETIPYGSENLGAKGGFDFPELLRFLLAALCNEYWEEDKRGYDENYKLTSLGNIDNESIKDFSANICNSEKNTCCRQDS